MDQQVEFDWPSALGPIAARIHPTFQEVFGDYPVEYYWTVHQSEWATDVVFRSSRTLAETIRAWWRQVSRPFRAPM